mmetsp:Transcript_8194/g.50919  ORF Transcript_8194/g.50919 Transcript_8194/m.50919 type:complete len:212 (-) Transcript_8194:4904-5539(-)
MDLGAAAFQLVSVLCWNKVFCQWDRNGFPDRVPSDVAGAKNGNNSLCCNRMCCSSFCSCCMCNLLIAGLEGNALDQSHWCGDGDFNFCSCSRFRILRRTDLHTMELFRFQHLARRCRLLWSSSMALVSYQCHADNDRLVGCGDRNGLLERSTVEPALGSSFRVALSTVDGEAQGVSLCSPSGTTSACPLCHGHNVAHVPRQQNTFISFCSW